MVLCDPDQEIVNLKERLTFIETKLAMQQRVYAKLLLYLRADMEVSWLASARGLEEALVQILDKNVNL